MPDHDRPLDKVGKDDALRMGKLIKDKEMIPSLIISSTALKAKTTAELVAKGSSYQGDIVLNPSLYEAKPKDYLSILETLSDIYGSVLIVGHNPTIEDTIQMLTDSSDVTAITSCALAHFSLLIEKWSDLSNNGKIEQGQAVLRENTTKIEERYRQILLSLVKECYPMMLDLLTNATAYFVLNYQL